MSREFLVTIVKAVDIMIAIINVIFIFIFFNWCAVCKMICASRETFKIQSFSMKTMFFRLSRFFLSLLLKNFNGKGFCTEVDLDKLNILIILGNKIFIMILGCLFHQSAL